MESMCVSTMLNRDETPDAVVVTKTNMTIPNAKEIVKLPHCATLNFCFGPYRFIGATRTRTVVVRPSKEKGDNKDIPWRAIG